jgi:SAM-dependent methyltransferase
MITTRLGLNNESLVIEIGSNDGYLLQYFKEKKIACLGIEPAKNTAKVAQSKGIEIVTKFFDSKLAKQLTKQRKQADLVVGNNVLAHVPDINDFVKGLKVLLKKDGVITLEFPHLMRLIKGNQFDTIYHEHFSYLAFHTVDRIFSKHSLTLFDVEELPTHGGSLRIYAKHDENSSRDISSNIAALHKKESAFCMRELSYYQGFQHKANKVKYDLLTFLIAQKQEGKTVVAYGAAAKGNTLLNYCGIKKDLIPVVVDASPHKQGKFLPESHIPVVNEAEINRIKPEFILILPWNIKEEIQEQLDYIRSWDGKFVIAIPELKFFSP